MIFDDKKINIEISTPIHLTFISSNSIMTIKIKSNIYLEPKHLTTKRESQTQRCKGDVSRPIGIFSQKLLSPLEAFLLIL